MEYSLQLAIGDTNYKSLLCQKNNTCHLNITEILFRTVKDIQVLEHCEIPPIRTTFVEELGEGAFGKVHKATHKDGREFFECQQDCSRRIREQFVAVKELHGEYRV